MEPSSEISLGWNGPNRVKHFNNSIGSTLDHCLTKKPQDLYDSISTNDIDRAVYLTHSLIKKCIESKILLLSEHVVAIARAYKNKTTKRILDPDYAVVIEKDMARVEHNPCLITQYCNTAIKMAIRSK